MNSNVSNDRSIQIYDYNIDRFEKQISSNKFDKLSNFLLSVVENNKFLTFNTETLFPRLLRLLPKANLSDYQHVRLLQFFRETSGLTEEGIFELLKVAIKLGDNPLIQSCIADIAEKIEDTKDIRLLRLLLETTRHLNDISFLKILKKEIFTSLFSSDDNVDFDAQLVKNLEEHPQEFAKSYLTSKQIPFTEMHGNKLKISLERFVELFNNRKGVAVLTFIADAIDGVTLQNNDFTKLYLIPAQYRKAIQSISYESPFMIPLEDIEKLQHLFPNANCTPAVDHEEIEKAVQANPNNPFFYAMLGDSWCDRRDSIKGEEAYEKAHALGPVSALACKILGYYFNEEDLLDDAEEQLRMAITLRPKLESAYNLLGSVLRQKDLDHEAEIVFRKAVELNPKSYRANQELADILTKKDKELSRRAALYEKDKKLIEEKSKATLKELAKPGQYQKFSRRRNSDLTHSYFITPAGKLLQQLHKSQGHFVHHEKDDHPVIIGKGGIKIACALADVTGYVSDIRAVVVREKTNLIHAIAASQNERFKSCENLLVGSYITYQSAKTGKLKQVFLSPYVSYGSLANKTFSCCSARSIILSVARGLQVVHSEGWAHLDIKPPNIFGKRLADFDLAVDFNIVPQDILIYQGTPGYESPEILQGKCRGKEAAQQSDMYALGITMFELCGFSIQQIIRQNVVKPTMTPEAIDKAIRDFMRQLDHTWLRQKFDEFKSKHTHFNDKDNEYLNLAWDLIDSDRTKRPTVDRVVEILTVT